jgi:hypothetical protein
MLYTVNGKRLISQPQRIAKEIAAG